MTMPRPPREDVLMWNAEAWALRSTCTRAQVGCVVSRDGRTLSTGYNGAPSGMGHCNHECTCDNRADRLPDDGEENHYRDCPSQQPCRNVIHAEANALVWAARHGVSTDGAEIHTTRVPCLSCAGLVINAGIIRVTWKESHRDMDGLSRLTEAGLEVVRWAHE